MEGTKSYKTGGVRSGKFAYSHVDGDMYLKKGIINNENSRGRYKGTIRKGDFIVYNNKNRREPRIILIKGSLHKKIKKKGEEFWEGEFFDFKWMDRKSKIHATFTFMGSIVFKGEKEEKKEGVWKAHDDGDDYMVDEYICDKETWERKQEMIDIE